MSQAISFHYDLMSQPSRAMWIILKMSGTAFESLPVALRKGEHLTEEYKQNINRFQKVPCINDNGFKLAESIAILRYLSNKGQISPALYPRDPKRRARVDEFLEWQHLNIRLGCSFYFRLKFLEPIMTGQEPPPEKVAKVQKIMEGSLDILENVWLDNTVFLTGNRLTAADIFAACELEQTRIVGYDVCDKYPRIKTWLNKVRKDTNIYYGPAHTYLNKIAGAQSKL